MSTPGFATFSPVGFVALSPRALNVLHATGGSPDNRVVDGAAIVQVTGPLSNRVSACFDSYDSILARVDSALAAKPSALVLVLDSPGGMAQGCIETARELRARCAAAGVPLLAYVEGEACSAAYALACAAERIAVTPSGVLGSIGVYETLRDQTAADSAMGLAYRVVSSGSRKLDGNPHVPISEAAEAALKVTVDHLAGLFYALVEESRPGLSANALRALDGGIAVGSDAVAKGLADVEVSNLSQLLGTVSAAAQTEPQTVSPVKTMEDIIKNLQAVLDDPNASDADKAKAKAMLDALTPAAPAEEPAAKAEDDKSEPEAAKAEDDKSVAFQAMREVSKLRAEIQKRDEESERSKLLATRPDFTPEMVAFFGKAPLAMVREAVSTFQRTPYAPAAAASVPVTVGESQASASSERLSPAMAAKLDARMGITKPEFGIVFDRERREQQFGASLPAKKA